MVAAEGGEAAKRALDKEVDKLRADLEGWSSY
jgi:hypothetical protein